MKRLALALPGLLVVVTIVVAVMICNRWLDHYVAGDFTDTLKIELGLSTAGDLPTHWRPSSSSETEVRVHSFELDTNSLDSQDLAIYFPIFQHEISVYINGTKLSDDAVEDGRSGVFPADTLLMKLPANLLTKNTNRLVVELQSIGPGFAYLYPFRVGQYASLLAVAKTQQFLLDQVNVVFIGALLILFMFSLSASLSTEDRDPFLWVMLGVLIMAVHTLLLFTDREGITEDNSFVSFGLIPVTAIAIWQYTPGLTQKVVSRSILLLVCLYLICWGIAVTLGGQTYIRFLFAITGPMYILVMLIALSRTFTRYLVFRERADLSLLTIFTLMLFAGVHDGLARSGLYTDWVMLRGSLYGGFLMTVVAAHLLWRRVRLAQVENELRMRLQDKLLKKEQELEVSFSKRQAATQMLALQNERSRILKELHDGVASQLVLISTIAQKPGADLKALRSIAQSALTDLRSVVSTLAIKNTDLLYVLALFREKYLKPLEGAGVKINWQLTDAANIYGFSSSQALHLLRLLQEAATNSVKHAAVTKIAVSVESLINSEGEIEKIVIHFEDEGEHSFEPNSLGLGIANMTARAHQLHATVDFIPQQHGVRVDILLNVKNDPESGLLCLADSSPQYGEL